MNKLVLVALMTLPSFLLCDQKEVPLHNSTPENCGPIKITPLHSPDSKSPVQSDQKNTHQTGKMPLIKPPQWILESSMDNAPELLKGIVFYLRSRQDGINRSQRIIADIPSFHRFILVGPPGTGKTTLAYAIAYMLGGSIVFVAATNLLGHFRNQTSVNIQNFLRQCTSDGLPKVIIIDELHKLFEHYADERADDSQSAAAFWLALDSIEKYNPNIIVIGTANNVEKLPPEIKSRFSGKIITMPLLNENQKIQIFKNSIAHDQSVVIDSSVDDAFITRMLRHIQNCSLRDVQLIIDAAKMFNYAQQSVCSLQFSIVLTRTHFQQALNQLRAESHVLQESSSERLYQKVRKWGVVFAVAANVAGLIKASADFLHKDSGFWKITNSLHQGAKEFTLKNC